MTISERIKRLCKEQSIPVSRLERDLGFGNGYVNSLKDGVVSAERLDKMCEYLHTSREYLATGELPEMSSVTGQKYYFSDETAQLAQAVFEDPSLRILLDAARDARQEDILMMADLLRKLKATNREG